MMFELSFSNNSIVFYPIIPVFVESAELADENGNILLDELDNILLDSQDIITSNFVANLEFANEHSKLLNFSDDKRSFILGFDKPNQVFYLNFRRS